MQNRFFEFIQRSQKLVQAWRGIAWGVFCIVFRRIISNINMLFNTLRSSVVIVSVYTFYTFIKIT